MKYDTDLSCDIYFLMVHQSLTVIHLSVYFQPYVGMIEINESLKIDTLLALICDSASSQIEFVIEIWEGDWAQACMYDMYIHIFNIRNFNILKKILRYYNFKYIKKYSNPVLFLNDGKIVHLTYVFVQLVVWKFRRRLLACRIKSRLISCGKDHQKLTAVRATVCSQNK